MKAIANIPNWHRYLIGALLAVEAIGGGLEVHPELLPPPLAGVSVWIPLAMFVVGVILAGTPRVQLPTGPGAPDVESPPYIPHG